ncbi:MAG TPA: ribosomal-processing cysteine protease Prp [Candidatus Sulfotelmatobacter sp.]|nr:ribosomal-processing cysteine protease Prp [Candidatus Sulfotelmatobacter sp.]
MLRVVFREDSRQRLSSVFATGHADTAPDGEDIACAAASALLQAAWAGLTDVAGVRVTGHRHSGDFLMRWPAESRERADVHAIVATAELGIAEIADQFPDAVACAREREHEKHDGEHPGTSPSKGTQR